MSDNSAIGWTDSTWNPVRGCTKVSAGCKNCYAETFAERWRGIKGHAFEQGFDLRLVPEALSKPLVWKRPRRIFVNSMSDLFHVGVPMRFIAAVFGVMAARPDHTFQVLTKRPANALAFFEWVRVAIRSKSYFPNDLIGWRINQMLASEARLHGAKVPSSHTAEWPLPNVHLGVSCEDQKTAAERIPILLECQAAVRWISAEPLLGPIDLFGMDDDGGLGVGWITTSYQTATDYGTGVEHGVDMHPGLDWVVVGGESGPHRRPCEVEWIESIVRQCAPIEVPCYVKQDGAARSGQQGRLSSELWAIKEFPRGRT